MADAAAHAADPVRQLQSFLAVQEQRAQCYGRFHAAFKVFLDTKQEGPFRRLMADLTGQFSALSQQVIAIEDALRSACGRADIASLLRTVQEHERDKLRLTLSLQALQQAQVLGGFSWQQDGQQQAQPSEAAGPQHACCAHGTPQQAQPGAPSGDAACSVHGEHGGGCGHGAGAAHEEAAEEPSEYEFNAAMREARLALDRAVLGINEALEEVRYALAELQEEEGACY